MDEINECWGSFQNRAGEYIKIIADSDSTADGVSEIFALKALDDAGNIMEYGAGESRYDALAMAQKRAVESRIKVNGLEKRLFEKKAEYNGVMSGDAVAAEAMGSYE